jgi:hypothetical protein
LTASCEGHEGHGLPAKFAHKTTIASNHGTHRPLRENSAELSLQKGRGYIEEQSLQQN